MLSMLGNMPIVNKKCMHVVQLEVAFCVAGMDIILAPPTGSGSGGGGGGGIVGKCKPQKYCDQKKVFPVECSLCLLVLQISCACWYLSTVCVFCCCRPFFF